MSSSNRKWYDVEGFFRTARERQHIKEDRLTWPSIPEIWLGGQFQNTPWAHYRFCNVFREDDRVTQWFKHNIRDRMHDNIDIVWSTILFRTFNLINTGAILRRENLLRYSKWDRQKVWDVLKAEQDAGNQIVTGAYMVKSPKVVTKAEGLTDALNWSHAMLPELVTNILENKSLEFAFNAFKTLPYQGNFTSYQFVCDLRFTTVLSDARDINTFVAPGPGCCRGIGRALTGNVNEFTYGKIGDMREVADLCRELLVKAQYKKYWPHDYQAWELSTVQHWACEYDKYCRIAEGGRGKRRFELCT